MPLTVAELISIPTLKTRVVAGASGLDRRVDWAHSCELAEPWYWLGGGDLLMTIGHGFPADADGQVAYLTRLAEADLSGLALAEGMFAAVVTDAARSAADELGFPVLETAFEVPFISMARAVADSNQREAQSRLARVLRIYDTFRQGISEAVSDEAAFARIGQDVGVALHVLDTAESRIVMSTGERLGADAAAQIFDQLRARKGPLPAVVRLRVGETRYVVQPLAAGEHWVLVTVVDNAAVIDLVVLQHVATIVEIQLERRRAADLARLHAGARLLGQILQGRIDSTLAASELAGHGIQGPPWWVVILGDIPTADLLSVQRRFTDEGVPHLIDRSEAGLVVLTDSPPDSPSVRAVAAEAGARVGASDAVYAVGRCPEALREARWALAAAAAGSPLTRHGEDRSIFLPRTVTEGDAVVARVLGPIAEYDAEHGTDLLDSLETFYDVQRSWQAAAERLCIHKQTLVYRMKRIESITGRQLDNLDDIAELHLALRTRRLLQGRARAT